jgi:cytochrome c553
MKIATNTWRANLLFALLCIAILLVLFKAPPETTALVPNDAQHTPLLALKDKKEAEKFCADCHGPQGQAPLRSDHPPKYRCLFCHKTR